MYVLVNMPNKYSGLKEFLVSIVLCITCIWVYVTLTHEVTSLNE